MGRPTLRTPNLVHIMWHMEQKTRITYRQAPRPPRSKVKVARSRGASHRCWLISRERKASETPKLVRMLPTPRAIMRTSFKVKRSKVKVSRQINVRVADATWLMWNGQQMSPRSGEYRFRDTACFVLVLFSFQNNAVQTHFCSNLKIRGRSVNLSSYRHCGRNTIHDSKYGFEILSLTNL